MNCALREESVRQRHGRDVPSSGGAKALRNKRRIRPCSQRNESWNVEVHELESEKPGFKFGLHSFMAV